jgi:hypothetical protein
MGKHLLILALILFSACGNSTTHSSADTSAFSPIFTGDMKSKLSGTYETKCHATSFKALKVYGISDETFTGVTFNRGFRFFSDSDCQVPFAQLRQSGTYSMYSTGIAYVYNFSYLYPETQQIAILFDTIQFCARQDWQKQVWRGTTKGYENIVETIAPGDANLDTLLRTECYENIPNQCTQITLTKIASGTLGNP